MTQEEFNILLREVGTLEAGTGTMSIDMTKMPSDKFEEFINIMFKKEDEGSLKLPPIPEDITAELKAIFAKAGVIETAPKEPPNMDYTERNDKLPDFYHFFKAKYP